VPEPKFCDLLSNASGMTIDKWLISNFTGLSPLICREISWRSYGETDYRMDEIRDDGAALKNAFFSLMGQAKSGGYEPWLISDDGGVPKDFSYTHIGQYENVYKTKREESFSSLLDGYFTRSAQVVRMSQRSAATMKLMKTARERLVRKLTAQKMELEDTSKRDYFRECGDIITANFHLIKKGQQLLVAEDFYSESNQLREIKLDPLLTPQQNSAGYYKAYTKAKNARKFLDEQILAGEKELKYVESVIEQISRAESESDLSEIRSELEQTGYIRKSKQQKGKQSRSSPNRFLSSSGMRIFAGKNNIQNDKLTLKMASKSDIWLHAQKIHGAHVIISCAGVAPDEVTLSQAASIAAYYSSARADSKVPIDYTGVRNVKKPSGGRPGTVIYNDFNTILATADEELVKRLRVDN